MKMKFYQCYCKNCDKYIHFPAVTIRTILKYEKKGGLFVCPNCGEQSLDIFNNLIETEINLKYALRKSSD